MQARRPLGLPRRRKAARRGTAAVEFALVAPIFFMLMIGMIEVGRAIMVQQVLINASRVGARRAVMLSSSEQEVLDAVSNYFTGVGLTGVSASVAPDPAVAEGGDAITVTTTVAYSSVTWLPTPWFMGDKTLSATSVMRKEGF